VKGASLTLGDATSGAIQINDAINIPVPTVNMVTAGSVTQTAALTVNGGTGALNITSTGNVTLLDQNNSFDSVGGSSATGSFQIADGAGGLAVTGITAAGAIAVKGFGALNVTGAVTATNGAIGIISQNSSISVTAPINAGIRDLALGAGPGSTVTQTAAGILTAGGFIAAGINGITLGADNQVTGTVSLDGTSGDILFKSLSGYEVGGKTVNAGVVSVSTTLGIKTNSGTTELRTGGAVTQAQANEDRILGNKLLLLGTSPGASFELTNPFNNVAVIAGNAGGGISYVDASALATGSIGTTIGVNTSGSAVSLTALNGELLTLAGAGNEVQTITVTGVAGTFTLTFNGQTTAQLAFNATPSVVDAALESLSSVGAGNVNVTSAPGGYSIAFIGALANTNQPEMTANGSGGAIATVATTTEGGGVAIASGGGAITATADNVAITGAVNAGTGIVTLKPSTAGVAINLGGADAAGVLGLTAAELNLITAGALVIGDGAAGDITISVPLAPSGTSQLELVTGGQISDSNAGTDITIARLGLTAGTGIGTGGTSSYLELQVSNLEATTGTGGIFLNNTGDVIIGGVNGVLTGLTVLTSGDIHLNDAGGHRERDACG
jgi:hypothetical protein